MQHTMTLEQARDYINQLDLHYIIDTMCHESYPLPRWTVSDAQMGCQLYKNFLYLIKKHPQESFVPTREIDEFWHNHILYTKKYSHDCMQIFGHYLHHEPADRDENPTILIAQYEKTKQLYLEEFKQPLRLTRV